MMDETQTDQELRLVTEQDLAWLDKELDIADAHLRHWEPQVRQLTLARAALGKFIGRPIADVKAALVEAEADLASTEADLAAKRERLRDIQGYVRIQQEHIAELKEQPQPEG